MEKLEGERRRVVQRHDQEFASLKFFIANSRTRFHRVKSGCKLNSVLDMQASQSKSVLRFS